MALIDNFKKWPLWLLEEEFSNLNKNVLKMSTDALELYLRKKYLIWERLIEKLEGKAFETNRSKSLLDYLSNKFGSSRFDLEKEKEKAQKIWKDPKKILLHTAERLEKFIDEISNATKRKQILSVGNGREIFKEYEVSRQADEEAGIPSHYNILVVEYIYADSFIPVRKILRNDGKSNLEISDTIFYMENNVLNNSSYMNQYASILSARQNLNKIYAQWKI